MNPLADVRAAAELWRILRRERPHVLHTHNPKPGLYGRVVGRLAGVPIVVNTCHGLYFTETDAAAEAHDPAGARGHRRPLLRRRAGAERGGPRPAGRAATPTRGGAPACWATASTSTASAPGVLDRRRAGRAARRRARCGRRPGRRGHGRAPGGREGPARAVRRRPPARRPLRRGGHRPRRPRQARRPRPRHRPRGADGGRRAVPRHARRRRPAVRRHGPVRAAVVAGGVPPGGHGGRRPRACRSSPRTCGAAGRWSTTR